MNRPESLTTRCCRNRSQPSVLKASELSQGSRSDHFGSQNLNTMGAAQRALSVSEITALPETCGPSTSNDFSKGERRIRHLRFDRPADRIPKYFRGVCVEGVLDELQPAWAFRFGLPPIREREGYAVARVLPLRRMLLFRSSVPLLLNLCPVLAVERERPGCGRLAWPPSASCRLKESAPLFSQSSSDGRNTTWGMCPLSPGSSG